MSILKLGKRLMAAKSYVRQHTNVADIGTDHGYLPASLAMDGMQKNIIAADINKKPLDSAKRTLIEFGVLDKVQLVLSDGLQGITADTADDIVICGMGGELIWSIIEKASWLKNEKKRLILQPMSFSDWLREQLYKNGYTILDETAVIENQKIYSVMCVEYTGEKKNITPQFALCGLHSQKTSPQSKAYVKHQKEKIEKIAEGLSKSQNQSEKAAFYLTVLKDWQD